MSRQNRAFQIGSFALVLISFGLTEAAAVKAAEARASGWRTVYEQGFEKDADDDGVVDEWRKAARRNSRCWLDKTDKRQGQTAQGCDGPNRFCGVWSPRLEIVPDGLYRLSFWLKVTRGQVKVMGQARLLFLGFADIYDPSNAGEWRHVTRVARAMQWHTSHPGHAERIWALAESKDGAEFRIDGLKVEFASVDPDRIVSSAYTQIAFDAFPASL